MSVSVPVVPNSFVDLERDLDRALQSPGLSWEDLECIRASSLLVRDELDTQILAGALVRHAVRVFRAERALLVLLNAAEATLRVASIDGGITYECPVRLGRDESLASLALRHHQAFLENSPLPGSDRGPCFALERPCKSLLTIPIYNHQRQIIALLEIHNRRDRAFFRNQDLRLAELFALQSSIGLERARLYDRMNEWSQSLEMLLGFNAAVNQHLSPGDLIRRLVENAARFLKADGGQAGLMVSLGQGLDCMESEGYFYRGRWHERGQRWKRMEGLPGLVLESEFPYLANDYCQDRQADTQLASEFGIARALCVPIKNSDSEVLGFFELHKASESMPFTWQDAAFLESLGNTTAVAIFNAQLLKTLEGKNRQIHALSAHHLQRLEEERRHIARELHDEAGQVLIGIKLALQVVARRIPENLPELRDEIDQLREQVNSATGQLKDLARRLRPTTLDQLGLDVALAQLANDFERLSGVRVEFDVDRLQPAPAQDCAIALYRIAQEAFTNTGRYAEASHVRLALWRDGGLLIFEYEDNGVGFDCEALRSSASSGLGLLGMRERAQMLRGRIDIASRPGAGTRITLEVPGA